MKKDFIHIQNLWYKNVNFQGLAIYILYLYTSAEIEVPRVKTGCGQMHDKEIEFWTFRMNFRDLHKGYMHNI